MIELYDRQRLRQNKNYNIDKLKENIIYKKEYTKAHDKHFFEQRRLNLTKKMMDFEKIQKRFAPLTKEQEKKQEKRVKNFYDKLFNKVIVKITISQEIQLKIILGGIINLIINLFLL